MAVTFFRQCVVNGMVKFEIQNIFFFHCEIKLVPTLIFLLLVVYIVLFKWNTHLQVYRLQEGVSPQKGCFQVREFLSEMELLHTPFLRKIIQFENLPFVDYQPFVVHILVNR